MDTFNKFMVCMHAGSGKIGVMNLRPDGLLSPDECVNLAAWLLALSAKPTEEFEKMYLAVTNGE